jgi:beta-aspartyl-peptidase (threonine type)
MRKMIGISGVLLLAAGMMMAQAAAGLGTSGAGTKSGGTNGGEAEAAIRGEIASQVAAWNHGDLKGYMQGYWHSAELTFFAGESESAGWEAAYQRYRTAYLGKGKEMGKLEFSKLRVELLAPDAAFVRGSWQLTVKDGSKRRGLFTVVLRKFDEGWRIIHDHSS